MDLEERALWVESREGRLCFGLLNWWSPHFRGCVIPLVLSQWKGVGDRVITGLREEFKAHEFCGPPLKVFSVA